MTYRMNRVFIASLSAVSLILAANETFARTGTAPGGGAALAHPVLRPLVARSLHHHRGNNLGAFWPGADDQSYAPSNVEPNMGVAAPVSGEMHYTYTDDVPWDAVHRFPPAVTPSARPYVQECTAETVTVPRHGGAEQTASVNIMRCY